MKQFALALAIMAVATGAKAQQRPSTPSLPCGQVQQIVDTYGAVVLGTGPYTYDRYVRDGSFCLVGETTEPAWVPTRDTLQCPVGYLCRSTRAIQSR